MSPLLHLLPLRYQCRWYRLSASVTRLFRRKAVPARSRILVLKLDAIGDFILATPFLRELRRSFPTAFITLVTRPATHTLAKNCPHTDQTLTFDPDEDPGTPRAHRTLRALKFGRRLADQAYDTVVVPRWDSDFYDAYAIACAVSPRRIVGFHRLLSSVGGSWLTHLERRHCIILEDGEPTHEVRRNLRLIESLGACIIQERLELWPTESERRSAKSWLAQFPTDANYHFVALGIGGSIPEKCWPESYFAALCRELQSELNLIPILIGGGKADVARAAKVLSLGAGPRVINAVGRFSLGETAALLAEVNLFAGNDSGPLHMAVASRCPTILISGFVANDDAGSDFSPVRFGPRDVPHRVVQPTYQLNPEEKTAPPVERLRIASVAPATVLAAVIELLPAIHGPRQAQSTPQPVQTS